MVVTVSARHMDVTPALKQYAEEKANKLTKYYDRIQEMTDGRGADVVFELVATESTMAPSTAMLARRGRLVFVGYSEDTFTVHPIQLVILEAQVLGSVGNTLAELEEAVRLVAEGKVRTVVDRVLPLESYAAALDALREGRVMGRVVLAPQRSE